MKITKAEKLILVRKTSMIINDTSYLNEIRLRQTLKNSFQDLIEKTPIMHYSRLSFRKLRWPGSVFFIA